MADASGTARPTRGRDDDRLGLQGGAKARPGLTQFRIANRGKRPRTFSIAGRRSPFVKPRKQATLTVRLVSTGPPGGWIEIDLGAQHDISLIRLVVAQTPPGRAVHKVYGRPAAGGALGAELYELDASTVDGQTVEIAPASPWSGVRYLRIHTVWGPSWPAWREIQVFKAL